MEGEDSDHSVGGAEVVCVVLTSQVPHLHTPVTAARGQHGALPQPLQPQQVHSPRVDAAEGSDQTGAAVSGSITAPDPDQATLVRSHQGSGGAGLSRANCEAQDGILLLLNHGLHLAALYNVEGSVHQAEDLATTPACMSACIDSAQALHTGQALNYFVLHFSEIIGYESQYKEHQLSREVAIIKQISKVVKELSVYCLVAGGEVTEEAVVPHHVLHVSEVQASPGAVREHLVSNHHTLSPSLPGHLERSFKRPYQKEGILINH